MRKSEKGRASLSDSLRLDLLVISEPGNVDEFSDEVDSCENVLEAACAWEALLKCLSVACEPCLGALAPGNTPALCRP